MGTYIIYTHTHTRVTHTLYYTYIQKPKRMHKIYV